MAKRPTAEQVRHLFDYDPATGSLRWRVAKARRIRPGALAATAPNSDGYVGVKIDGRTYKAHRLAWAWVHGAWPEAEVDHINGDRADNRIANLRLATNKENARNRLTYKNNRSGYRGVYWNSALQKWGAQIRTGGKRHHLGFFLVKEDAAEAYRVASPIVHGQFGRAD